MQFITETTNKKRKMIFLPELNPTDFLFFFEKGSGGRSYSLRDYSIRDSMSPQYANAFPCSASEILAKARYVFDAPTISTDDLGFWFAYTMEGRKYLQRQQDRGGTIAMKEPGNALGPTEKPVSTSRHEFPILDRGVLEEMPKFWKRGDVERMLTSPNSEDWITWNVFRLMAREPETGWTVFRGATAALGLDGVLEFAVSSVPRVSLWRTINSPPSYESASRRRMRESQRPDWIARARNPKPVEGVSEIDVEISTTDFLLFIEAKLGSDISMGTTYDPARNQIIRNIDCVIEQAGSRVPVFGMLVRDLGPGRAYVQLMREYRDNPASLAAALPHRDPAVVADVARRLVLILWRDLAVPLCAPTPGDDYLVRSVKAEVLRRIG